MHTNVEQKLKLLHRNLLFNLAIQPALLNSSRSPSCTIRSFDEIRRREGLLATPKSVSKKKSILDKLTMKRNLTLIALAIS